MPLLHYIFDHYIFPYIAIGVLVAIVIDLSIHYTKSSNRFTFAEIWGAILFWPIVLYVFIRGFFNQD